MKNKLRSFIIVCVLTTAGFLGFLTFESEDIRASGIIYVDDSGGADYTTIQEGIDAANPGDTVYVYNGTYYENVIVNKTINLSGEDRDTTVINASEIGYGVYISADWVNITGFTTIGPESEWDKGIIMLDKVYNCRVIDNKPSHRVWSPGILLNYSDYNTIADNIGIQYRDPVSGEGIYLFYSNNNIVINNTFSYLNNGIQLDYSNNNTITENNLYDNGEGIGLLFSSNNTIANNTIIYNIARLDMYGIVLLFCSLGYNTIIDNTIIGNNLPSNHFGIWVWYTSDGYNTFVGNSISSNNYGIYFSQSSSYNTFIGNTISSNEYGIFIENSGNNTFIENSIFDNNYNVHMEQQSRDNNFINCSLSNTAQDDFNLTEDSHAILLNTTFNKSNVHYGDTLSTLTVKWFVHVHVMYYNGTPVSNAYIWINDSYKISIYNGQADTIGWVKWLVVTEYLEQDMNGDSIGDRKYSTPHNVTATDGSLWGYANPNMDISKVVLIILGTPLPLLPPTNLTIKVVNNGNNVELEWDPPISYILDHYLIYRADSANEFDFTTPYNDSATWVNPLNTTWIDPDPSITQIDDDSYYIVRAANSDESDISSTSNTAGIWTKTFELGISTFSIPLKPFVEKDVEFYCEDMNASYIKWMNHTTHTWMRHDKGNSENNTLLELGEGYEVEFDSQTRYTFCGMPGAMIIYDDDSGFSGFDPDSEARNLSLSVEPNGDVSLTWQEPSTMTSGDWYDIYYSNTRDGFFRTFGVDYDLACPAIDFGTNSTTISGLGASDPGVRLYFMVVPFNASGIRGSSSYSIGVWTEEYLFEYDTMGIPMKLDSFKPASWYCNNIPDCVGINYYIFNDQRWGWHATRMPAGVFDVVLEMGVGYQISTSGATKFTFVGV